jgi:hypothetical protein
MFEILFYNNLQLLKAASYPQNYEPCGAAVESDVAMLPHADLCPLSCFWLLCPLGNYMPCNALGWESTTASHASVLAAFVP